MSCILWARLCCAAACSAPQHSATIRRPIANRSSFCTVLSQFSKYVYLMLMHDIGLIHTIVLIVCQHVDNTTAVDEQLRFANNLLCHYIHIASCIDVPISW